MEHTHGPSLAEDAEHQNRLENVKANQAKQREDDVQHVKTNVAVFPAQARVEVPGVAKGGIESNIPGADEQYRR